MVVRPAPKVLVIEVVREKNSGLNELAPIVLVETAKAIAFVRDRFSWSTFVSVTAATSKLEFPELTLIKFKPSWSASTKGAAPAMELVSKRALVNTVVLAIALVIRVPATRFELMT